MQTLACTLHLANQRGRIPAISFLESFIHCMPGAFGALEVVPHCEGGLIPSFQINVGGWWFVQPSSHGR